MNKSLKGFTIVELLIVIAIIGILAAAIVIGLPAAKNRAYAMKEKADQKSITNGINLVANKNNQVNPTPCNEGTIDKDATEFLGKSTNDNTINNNANSSCVTNLLKPFLSPIPTRPNKTGDEQYYTYKCINDCESFEISISTPPPPSNPSQAIIEGKEREQFGTKVANVGDQNGDGRDDFAVSAPKGNSLKGVIYIYSSTDYKLIKSISDWPHCSLECPVSGADFNGDGKKELLVSGVEGNKINVYSNGGESLLSTITGSNDVNLGFVEMVPNSQNFIAGGVTSASFNVAYLMSSSGTILETIKGNNVDDKYFPEFLISYQGQPAAVINISNNTTKSFAIYDVNNFKSDSFLEVLPGFWAVGKIDDQNIVISEGTAGNDQKFYQYNLTTKVKKLISIPIDSSHSYTITLINDPNYDPKNQFMVRDEVDRVNSIYNYSGSYLAQYPLLTTTDGSFAIIPGKEIGSSPLIVIGFPSYNSYNGKIAIFNLP